MSGMSSAAAARRKKDQELREIAQRKKEQELQEKAENRKAEARKKREEDKFRQKIYEYFHLKLWVSKTIKQLEELSTHMGIEPQLKPMFKLILGILKDGRKLSAEAKNLVELSDDETPAAPVPAEPIVKSKEDEREERRRQVFGVPTGTNPASSEPIPLSSIVDDDDEPVTMPVRPPSPGSLSREERRKKAFSIPDTPKSNEADTSTNPARVTGSSSKEDQRRLDFVDDDDEPVTMPVRPPSPGSLSRDERRKKAFCLPDKGPSAGASTNHARVPSQTVTSSTEDQVSGKSSSGPSTRPDDDDDEPIESASHYSESRPTLRTDDESQNGGRRDQSQSSTPPEPSAASRSDDDPDESTPPSTSAQNDRDEEMVENNDESPGYSPTSPTYSLASPTYSPASPNIGTPNKQNDQASREPSPTSPESPPPASTSRSYSSRPREENDDPPEYYPTSPVLSDAEDDVAPRTPPRRRDIPDEPRSPAYEPSSPTYDQEEPMESESNDQAHHPANASSSQDGVENGGSDEYLDGEEIIEVPPPPKKNRTDDERQLAVIDERPAPHEEPQEDTEMRRKLDEIKRLKREAQLKRREKHGAPWKRPNPQGEMVGDQSHNGAAPSTSWGQSHAGNAYNQCPPVLNHINYQQRSTNEHYPNQGTSSLQYRPPNAPPPNLPPIPPAPTIPPPPPLQMVPPLYPNHGYPSFVAQPQFGYNAWPMAPPQNEIQHQYRQEFPACPLCSKDHHPEDCTTYPSGMLRACRQREMNLCLLCLGNHRMANCHFEQYQLKCTVKGCGSHYSHAALCPVRYPEETSEERWRREREEMRRGDRDYRR